MGLSLDVDARCACTDQRPDRLPASPMFAAAILMGAMQGSFGAVPTGPLPVLDAWTASIATPVGWPAAGLCIPGYSASYRMICEGGAPADRFTPNLLVEIFSIGVRTR